MPNQSGNTKRKKRNEKAKITEVPPPADATCRELPSEVGAEASTISGGGEMPESKENSTGYLFNNDDVVDQEGVRTGRFYTAYSYLFSLVLNFAILTKPYIAKLYFCDFDGRK